MAIDKEKYIAKYITEGLENISLVESLVFDIKDGISVEDDLATLLRALHTLKGSSRMLEFKRVEELTHHLESVFVAIKEQRIALSENAVKLILGVIDLVKTGFNTIQTTKSDAIETQEYIKNLALLASNEEFSVIKNNETKNIEIAPVEEKSSAPKSSDTAVSPKQKQKDAKSDSIRVSLDKIDNIIKSIASLQSLEISAKSISQESAVFNNLVREYSKSIKFSNIKDNALLTSLRQLERLSEHLNSSVKNYAIDASNNIKGAYESVISLRTLPLSTIFDSYPRYVYELSQELGKKVQFLIEGKENEIDKNIIESLSEVIMHMVRNALDHGIETPQERRTRGKEETGKLSIVCTRESGSMKIVVTDDGHGIDHEKIRVKVVKEGFVTEAAAASLSREDLTNFLFHSGFSTSSKINNISGRGVGMNVVRETVENLKGSILVESSLGTGTSFTIMVPLSIAALSGFPVECGGLKFIIPANFVETIILINSEDIVTVVDRPEIRYNERLVKLYYLNHILNINDEIAKTSETLFIVIIRSLDDIAALAVDNIESMISVILKTMPAFMENSKIFSGIVLNEDYEMVTVLHIPTIIRMAKRIKTIDLKKRNAEFERLRKTILVVDDSRPTREIEKDILAAEGYIVDTAADGAQALKFAKIKQYDLICTDLRMPVMDGFMLIENIRKNDTLSEIPIIVISSIEDEKDKKRVFQLGASKYIIKNSFDNHNLLEAVNELIGVSNRVNSGIFSGASDE
jgi:chemotaxis protein histidine kinase CheA